MEKRILTEADFDTMLTLQVHGYWGRSALLDAAMAVLATWTPVVMLGLITLSSFGLFLVHGAADAAAHGFTAVVSALAARIVNEPISRWTRRPRPFETTVFLPLIAHERGDSFPSNHATGAFSLAMAMSGIPGYGPVLLVLAVLLCIARVYNGLHYATDVAAGALNGTLVALALKWLFLNVFMSLLA